MAKRILVTSTDMMMMQFLIPHLENLKQRGYTVEAACSDVGGRIGEVRERLQGTVDAVHEVRLVRSPYTWRNVRGYNDLKKLIDAGHYDIIWTNEPVMGVVTRMAARAARKQGTKVLYMVHGFHFYKGAPLRNWLLYYPVERRMAECCDTIVTINKEDFHRACRMRVPRARYVHGIGVNTERLRAAGAASSVRGELGLPEDSFLILSVGELYPRKNHQVMIRALSRVNDPAVHYLICGKGPLEQSLRNLAEDMGAGKQIHFLGYRQDVLDIVRQADVFALPSMREGLGLAGLEAMLCGLPILSSDASGPRDYMENGKTGFMYHPDDVSGFEGGIRTLKSHPELKEAFGSYNRQAAQPFCMEAVQQELLTVLEELS